jgi:hypothetical protein
MSIDKLSLQLLTNKSVYKKYISSTDPDAYKKIIDHKKNIKKYKLHILDIFSTLLDNPDKPITNDINNSFDEFVKICIKYFENQRLEKECGYGDMEKDPDYDDSNIFENKNNSDNDNTSDIESNDNDENENDDNNDLDEKNKNVIPIEDKKENFSSYSYWGTQIKKTNRNNLDSTHIKNYFYKNKK